MRLAELVEVSRSVAETRGRLDKIDRLAALLKRTPAEEIEIAAAFLSGAPRQGRLGLGGPRLEAIRDFRPAGHPTLELAEIDQTLGAIQSASGAGSTAS